MVEFPSAVRRDVLRSKKNWKWGLEIGNMDEKAYVVGLMLELLRSENEQLFCFKTRVAREIRPCSC